jgi:hypothetical protein
MNIVDKEQLIEELEEHLQQVRLCTVRNPFVVLVLRAIQDKIAVTLIAEQILTADQIQHECVPIRQIYELE